MSPRKTSSKREATAGTTARGLWALWFVAVSLVALAGVPAYFGARSSEVQERISVLEEAGALG